MHWSQRVERAKMPASKRNIIFSLRSEGMSYLAHIVRGKEVEIQATTDNEVDARLQSSTDAYGTHRIWSEAWKNLQNLHCPISLCWINIASLGRLLEVGWRSILRNASKMVDIGHVYEIYWWKIFVYISFSHYATMLQPRIKPNFK